MIWHAMKVTCTLTPATTPASFAATALHIGGNGTARQQALSGYAAPVDTLRWRSQQPPRFQGGFAKTFPEAWDGNPCGALSPLLLKTYPHWASVVPVRYPCLSGSSFPFGRHCQAIHRKGENQHQIESDSWYFNWRIRDRKKMCGEFYWKHEYYFWWSPPALELSGHGF